MIAATVTLAERPELADAMWSIPHTWAPFMLEDPVAAVFFGRFPVVFPDHQVLALDAEGTVIGKVNSIPFVWAGTEDDLPDRGWDAVLERGFTDHERGHAPNAVSLLEARIVPAHRGTGLSARLLEAVRDNVRRLGIPIFFGPVRPTEKRAIRTRRWTST